jgi:hypothetical protein
MPTEEVETLRSLSTNLRVLVLIENQGGNRLGRAFVAHERESIGRGVSRLT